VGRYNTAKGRIASSAKAIERATPDLKSDFDQAMKVFRS
jgi:hypothetical protein